MRVRVVALLCKTFQGNICHKHAVLPDCLSLQLRAVHALVHLGGRQADRIQKMKWIRSEDLGGPTVIDIEMAVEEHLHQAAKCQKP